MKDKDSKLSNMLVDACSRLSSFTESPGFIEPADIHSILEEFRQLKYDADRRSSRITYALGLVDRTLKTNIIRFQKLYDDAPRTLHVHNEGLAQKLATDIGEAINPVERCDLDRQQLTAIAYDVRTRLIIAGAGTGKTTTIIGFVKDLLLSGKARPDDILLLSFTNASVNELKSRIRKETGQMVETTTFHRLALKIIAEAQEKVPGVTHIDIRGFLTDEILRRRADPEYMRRLIEYIAYDCDSLHDEGRFSDGSEMQAYLRENPLYTMNGERVKSFGESDIANYLALNGIPYIYEDRYEIDTADSEYGPYYPDFHIEGTNVYIEYFGIDREGNVAGFMVDRNPDAAKEYREGMEWKRGIHTANGTRLIELYSYQRFEGELIDILERKLGSLGIESQPRSPESIIDRTFANDRWKLNSLVSDFTTAILLIKGFGRPWDDVFPECRGNQRRQLERMELLLKPLYDAYQTQLADRNEIDFEDMLNLASKHVQEGRYVHSYRYVVVDEYQDISRSRFELLRSMRGSKDYRLFCVGDDWQSIYRFNGCDVSYLLDFERYWGPSAICRIERTYRFSGELLEKSSDFISRNGRQYSKHLIGMMDRNSRVHPLFASTEQEIRHKIADVLLKMPKGKEVLFLGRYNHDVRLLSEDGFSWMPSISDNSSEIRFSRCPGLNMRFMTIHSSKGLQSDIVISLNNRTGKYGFPNRRDEPVLISLLLGSDNDRYDEERRLFYVAMTRAKDAAYIVSVTGHQSDFFKEIFPCYDKDSGLSQMICPLCGGVLILKEGRYGRFYGCSNYSSRGCRFTRGSGSAKDRLRRHRMRYRQIRFFVNLSGFKYRL